MADHHTHPQIDLTRDRTLGDRGPGATRKALFAGLACIGIAAVLSLLGGQSRLEQTYHPESAPTALVGVVRLLSDKEGKPVAEYAGRPLTEIASAAESQFGKELPPHWDDFLKQRSSGWQGFQAGYLVAFLFVTSISCGALFFVLIQHLVRAGWSVVVRRIAELLAASAGWVALLSLPIVIPLFLGNHAIYEWNDATLIETDHLIRHKQPWLNPTFFAIRTVIYFGIWTLLGRFFLSHSRQQDETGDVNHTHRMQALAPLGTLLFALTANFFAFDFMMSVDPHWFSAIYGIYFFAGAIVSALAVMILGTMYLQKRQIIGPEVTVEHYHDLAKLLFGFNFFWGYIAFSQYLLIWYANIPEETGWLILRQENGWEWVSLTLLFGHLLIPFFGLMSRHTRRNMKSLAFWSVWLLLMHALDIYWNVIPQFHSQVWPTLSDILLLLGVSSLFLAGFIRTASTKSFVAVRDPRLEESLAFHNV
ncbi:quinol:cytochrome C oxidoreductase [Schlesneria sp. DSM 10557]|uniref:quinol:cytochrome C oxidoreductase n=1 Tax=Schlesneria sp. DSM 10557 TaxID=3044399 RepID=UPI0035A11204